MSKDSRYSFPERLKRWLKSECGNVPLNQHITLTEELRAELSSKSPTSTRIKAIKELDELMSTRKLEENGIESVWHLVQDLLGRDCPSEQRHVTLQMLTTLTTAHEDMGLMRCIFFNFICENYHQQEIKPFFDLFCGVIAEGRHLEYIEEFVGSFLLDWLPAVLASPQTLDALHVIINLVKFNSAFLDEEVIMGYVKHVVTLLHQAKSEEEAALCLAALESFIAYSSIPSCSLNSVIIVLTRVVNIPQLTVTVFQIMHCLAGTHVGNSGVRVLCHLIEKAADPQIVRGAVFFLTTVLWGSKKVSSLSCTPFAVLPTLYKASQNSDVLVVFEVALGIQKLVTRNSFELYLHSWNIVIEMLTNAFRSAICLEDDSTEKTTILSVLMDTMDTIEQLVEKQEFRGSLERFYFLVDLYSHLWPEDSVVKLLDYQAKIINPFHPLWLVNLRALLSHHYCLDTRTSIKMKALTILTNVYSNNRHMYGRDIVKTVVLIHLEGVEKETDVRVRTAVVNLLIQIADTQESEIVLDVLSILEKVVTAPYKRNGKPLVQESEATDIVAAVEGLIKVYKVKMFELPSSHAVVAYRILLSFLEYHYCNQIILERVTRIRYQILEMILEMRVNSKYQIGFPGLNIKDGKDKGGLVSFPLPCFSPYLTVDHKPGQKLSAAHREREQQEEELLGFSPTRIHNVLTKGRKHELVKSSEETVKENTPHIAAVESLPPKFEVTSLSLIETAKIIITSLNKEKDWIVLCFILQRLPRALQNKIVVLSQGDTDTFLVSALCDLVADKSRNLPDCLYNKPARFSRSAFQGYVYPVLAMLASHHLHLDCDIQQKVEYIIKFLSLEWMYEMMSMKNNE